MLIKQILVLVIQLSVGNKMGYENFRKQKDWISFRKKDGSIYIHVITFGKKYGWEVEIKTNTSYPILNKRNITKTQALSIAKKFMEKN